MINDRGCAQFGNIKKRRGPQYGVGWEPKGIWHHVGRNEPKYIIATKANRFRRGLYTVWRRGAPYASFVTFDALGGTVSEGNIAVPGAGGQFTVASATSSYQIELAPFTGKLTVTKLLP